MKKLHFLPLFLLICMGVFAQNVSLDQAVETSGKTVETRLPQGSKAAVLTFTSSSQGFSDYVLDELAIAIGANRKIQVIERQYMDVIRKELNIQMSGDVRDNEIKSVGKQLGAQYVVTGSLADIGNAYRFRAFAINVESAVREAQSSLNINIDDPQVVFLLTGKRPAQTSNTNTVNTGTYKIGDTCPAGCIVFFDRGFAGDGWRYLKAAPAGSEFTAQWGAYTGSGNSYKGIDVSGTMTAVGFGKQNTKIIVERVNGLRETNKAAQLCAALDISGYKDWFLPSKD